MQKITPFLWFDNNAEDAVNFYVSVFKNSKIVHLNRLPDSRPDGLGQVLMAVFEIEGQPFYTINGGPMFTFSQATSFFINCESQEEVDYLWEKLSEGGEAQMCGWVKDKFGVTWQVIPSKLSELMGDPDPEKSGRVIQVMLQMTKIEIQGLQDAYDGK